MQLKKTPSFLLRRNLKSRSIGNPRARCPTSQGMVRARQKGPCSSRATCCHREGHKSHPSHCRHKLSTIPSDPPVPAHPLSSGQLPTPQAPLTFLGRTHARLACGTPARARAPTLGEAPRQRVRWGPLTVPRSPAATGPARLPERLIPGLANTCQRPPGFKRHGPRTPGRGEREPLATEGRLAPAAGELQRSRLPAAHRRRTGPAGRAEGGCGLGGRKRAWEAAPPGARARGFLPASAGPSSRSRRWKDCGNSPARVASSAAGPAPAKGKHARAGARTRVGSGVAVPTQWQRAPAALRTTAARGGEGGRAPSQPRCRGPTLARRARFPRGSRGPRPEPHPRSSPSLIGRQTLRLIASSPRTPPLSGAARRCGWTLPRSPPETSRPCLRWGAVQSGRAPSPPAAPGTRLATAEERGTQRDRTTPRRP